MSTDIPLILQLNDDCLWTIFSYLNLPDLLNGENVCRKFKEIAEMHYRTCRVLDFTKPVYYYYYKREIREASLEAIAIRVGPYVQVLKIRWVGMIIPSPHGDLPIFLKHFVNVQYLYLSSYELTHESCIGILPEISPALKYIEMNRCFFLEKSLAMWLKNSPKLEVLKILEPSCKMKCFSGECFAELKGITELKIQDCHSMNTDFFQKFCELNPQLRKLCISDTELSPDPDNTQYFQSIAENFKNLETLALEEYARPPNYNLIFGNSSKLTRIRIGSIGYEWYDRHSRQMKLFLRNIAQKNHIECLNIKYTQMDEMHMILSDFKHLKVLILNANQKNGFSASSNLFQILSCSETLEEIHLLGHNVEVISRDFKDFIQNFKSLKLIKFWKCKGFDISFLLDIEECLQKRNQIMEFIVNKTPIEQLMKDKDGRLQGFMKRNKGKVKFTILGKRTFHEWEEWESCPYEI